MSGQHSTADRLRNMLHKPGPYLTAYFDVMEDDLASQWESLLPLAQHKGIPQNMTDAVEARIGLPVDAEVGGWGIIVASDGSTEVFTSPDAPRRPIVNMSPIPYMAPALEWDHRDVPHVVVVATEEGIDIVPFVAGNRPVVTRFSRHESGVASPDAIAALTEFVRNRGIELVAVGGDEQASNGAAAEFRRHLPPTTLINVLPADQTLNVDEFSDAVVREVSNVHATRTVNALKEFRFEKSHGSAAEGTTDVLNSLRDENIRTLLIHDDPDDSRVVAMSDSDDFSSLGEVVGTVDGTHAVRLVDAAIAAALVHGADVHIIPTTGRTGPADDLAVILDDNPGAGVSAEATLETPGADTEYVNVPVASSAERGGDAIFESPSAPSGVSGDEIVA